MTAKFSGQDRLEKRLAVLAKDISFDQKANLKHNLLERIEVEQSYWFKKVQLVGKELKLAPNHHFLIKEAILSVMRSSRWSWRHVAGSWRNAFANVSGGLRWSTAVALAFVMVFSVVMGPWLGLERADASEVSYLQNFDGDVKILRGEQELKGEQGLLIQQADQIVVGANSVAELRFVNDNLVRLRENSKLVIEKLVAETPKQSVVRLNLVDGQGWFKIFSAGGRKAEFKVKTEEILISANQESAFDVKNTSEHTRVVAVNNAVDMVLSHNQQLIATTLRPEYMVKVRANTPFASYQERLKFVEKVQNEDLDWFERNLLADKWYQEELQGRLRDSIASKAGLTPDNPFYSLKQFKRKARLALTFDEVKKEEVKLDIAKEKFYEAHKSLNEGKKELAQNLLNDFEKETVEVSKKADQIALENPKKVEDLKTSLNDGLVEQKQSLVGLADGVSLAKAKETIEKVEIATEKEVVEKAELEKPVVTETEPQVTDMVKKEEPKLDVDLDLSLEQVEAVTEVALPEVQQLNFDLTKLEVRVENVLDLKEVKEKAGVAEEPTSTEDPVIEEVIEPKVENVEESAINVVIEPVIIKLDNTGEVEDDTDGSN